MAYELRVKDITRVAAADLDSYQFYGVSLNSSGNIVLHGALTAVISVGILQTKPKSGEGGEVRTIGISKAVSNGSTTAGKPQKFSSGKVTDVTADGDRYNCIALEAAATDGIVISVLMEHGYYYTA